METELKAEFGKLGENIKRYAETRIDLFKLKLVDKLSSGIAAMISGALVAVMLLSVLFFASVSLAFYLGDLQGSLAQGFLLVAGIYLLVLILILLFRKAFIHDPVAGKIIRGMLTSDDYEKE